MIKVTLKFSQKVRILIFTLYVIYISIAIVVSFSNISEGAKSFILFPLFFYFSGYAISRMLKIQSKNLVESIALSLTLSLVAMLIVKGIVAMLYVAFIPTATLFLLFLLLVAFLYDRI